MIFNIGSGSPAGETLFITAPAGVTVTVQKDGRTKMKIADNNGLATFRGLTNGFWSVQISDGEQTSTRLIEIVSGYSMTMAFFSAIINVKYPAGSICTCSDGTTTLTATDTSGSFAFDVPNAGTWTVTSTNGEFTKSETIVITTEGQNESIELLYYQYLFNDGSMYNSVTGGWQGIGPCAQSTTDNTIPTIDTATGAMVVTTRVSNKNTDGCSIQTAKEIDLTPYNKLWFDVAAINGSDIKAGIKGTMQDDWVYTLVNGKALVAGMNEIDISSMTGSHTIIVSIVNLNGVSTSITFNSIYLE